MNDSRKKGRELLIWDGEEWARQEWIKVQLSTMITFLMRFLGFPSSLRVCLSSSVLSSSYGHSVFYSEGYSYYISKPRW